MHLQYLSFCLVLIVLIFVIAVDNVQHDELVICHGLVLYNYKSYYSYISFLFSCQVQ